MGIRIKILGEDAQLNRHRIVIVDGIGCCCRDTTYCVLQGQVLLVRQITLLQFAQVIVGKKSKNLHIHSNLFNGAVVG
jgi:hypothetical protein